MFTHGKPVDFRLTFCLIDVQLIQHHTFFLQLPSIPNVDHRPIHLSYHKSSAVAITITTWPHTHRTMVQTRSTTAAVCIPSVGPGASHHNPIDSQAGETISQEEEIHTDTPPSQATTAVVATRPSRGDPSQSQIHSDDTEGKQAEDFGRWRHNTGLSRQHLKSLFHGSEVGHAGNFYHPETEEPEWHPDDFDDLDDANHSPETMEGVETAEKSEISVRGSDSELQSSLTGDGRRTIP